VAGRFLGALLFFGVVSLSEERLCFLKKKMEVNKGSMKNEFVNSSIVPVPSVLSHTQQCYT